MIKPFQRLANYYETDKMAIIHHSNYIRWFEEARLYYMEQNGLPFYVIEDSGLLVPVLSVDVQYKKPARYGDIVEITEWLTKFSQVKFEICYEIRHKDTKELLVTGKTGHCFVDKNMQPVRLKKDYPEIYNVFERVAKEDKLSWKEHCSNSVG